MKLIAFILGAFVGYALGSGAVVAGIVAVMGVSTPVFCAVALGLFLALIV